MEEEERAGKATNKAESEVEWASERGTAKRRHKSRSVWQRRRRGGGERRGKRQAGKLTIRPVPLLSSGYDWKPTALSHKARARPGPDRAYKRPPNAAFAVALPLPLPRSSASSLSLRACSRARPLSRAVGPAPPALGAPFLPLRSTTPLLLAVAASRSIPRKPSRYARTYTALRALRCRHPPPPPPQQRVSLVLATRSRLISPSRRACVWVPSSSALGRARTRRPRFSC